MKVELILWRSNIANKKILTSTCTTIDNTSSQQDKTIEATTSTLNLCRNISTCRESFTLNSTDFIPNSIDSEKSLNNLHYDRPFWHSLLCF